mmetsp:Transcript_25675/g.76604  ORF Transcript_25675/g.76604 Transcript_25675/m.76604 type:complete len:356 (-) Transcript_25675:8-1075(-)
MERPPGLVEKGSDPEPGRVSGSLALAPHPLEARGVARGEHDPGLARIAHPRGGADGAARRETLGDVGAATRQLEGLLLLLLLLALQLRVEAGKIVRPVEARVHHLQGVDPALPGGQYLAPRVEAGDHVLDPGELQLADQIRLVQDYHIRILDLLHQQVREALLFWATGNRLQIVEEVGGVHHRHARVQPRQVAEGLPLAVRLVVLVVLVARSEHPGHLRRLRDARGLDDHVVELLLLGQSDDLLHQVAPERAAHAPVVHRDHVVALHQIGMPDEALVDVELGHVIDDHGAPELAAIRSSGLQDVLQQRGLPRAQYTRQNRHGRARRILRHLLSVVASVHGGPVRKSWGLGLPLRS